MAAQLPCCNINKPSPAPASCPHPKLLTHMEQTVGTFQSILQTKRLLWNKTLNLSILEILRKTVNIHNARYESQAPEFHQTYILLVQIC